MRVLTTDYDRFESAIQGADEDVDLFGAAMTIARIGRDRVDEHGAARRLDLMAEAIRDGVGPTLDTQTLVQAIDHELFTVQGFHGNTSDYYDPANSFLDRVIERRRGIPLTLSLVFMEVAQRVGLRCDGIGFPGHFLVRCGDPEEPVYVDPFHQGARVDREELLAGLRGQELHGASAESYLAAVTRRQLLQRMLHNLHAIYRSVEDRDCLLPVVEFLVRLEPWNPALYGERGLIHYRNGDAGLAVSDLERFLMASEPQSATPYAQRALDELRLQLRIKEDAP